MFLLHTAPGCRAPCIAAACACCALFYKPPCLGAGVCHAHNVGVSLLNAVGLQRGWVATDQDEYAALAVAAARDVQGLAALRAGLRARMLASPLCDGRAFVGRLEDTYRQLWRRWLQGEGRGGAAFPGKGRVPGLGKVKPKSAGDAVAGSSTSSDTACDGANMDSAERSGGSEVAADS